ncbi:dimerization protein [Spatholobus suberectus]|nr:dimerization protein [Spatholobus suberectus]
MDGVFALPEAARADFLRSLMHSFGCTYSFVFLGWVLRCKEQPTKLFFGECSRNTSSPIPGCVPGVAFKNHLPYIELQQLDLLRLTSTEIQTQFFQIAVFMGCKKGEIELGFSNMPQADIQTALKNLFPEDFQSTTDHQNPHSSSSSFISLSTGSPECSSLLLSIPGTSQSHFPETHGVVPTQTSPPHQQSIQALAQVNIPRYFPTPEGEHGAIVRALLHVISSPSSSTSQQHQPQQNFPNYASVIHPVDTAFKIYGPDISTPHMGSNFRNNRSFAFFRNLNLMRMRERNIIQAARPFNIQQYRAISERRRREKLSKSFQALRALLPPGTKKSKASILTTAKETMRSLMDEIEKLNIRNQQLMTVLPAKEATSTEENKGSSSNERLSVRVSHVLESSSSEEQMVDLQVTVRGESSRVDVLIRLLEFLERVQNVNLISMDANNHITGGTAINQLTFRLMVIEGSEWDQLAFQEAVRRVVADLNQLTSCACRVIPQLIDLCDYLMSRSDSSTKGSSKVVTRWKLEIMRMDNHGRVSGNGWLSEQLCQVSSYKRVDTKLFDLSVEVLLQVPPPSLRKDQKNVKEVQIEEEKQKIGHLLYSKEE